jgi:thiol-disulfide isomerase/thioredoxin
MTDNAPNSGTPIAPSQSQTGLRLRNLFIALVAVALSVSLFLGLNTQSGTGLLTAMAEEAVPLEIALGGEKPTLMEFYANWCTTCQSMAPTLKALKQEYGDRVNFVMLNVDNTKWLPEVLQYRVDGIPYFVFLGQEGQTVGEAIGEQPKPIMAANLIALSSGDPLPYAQSGGKTSAFSPPVAPAKTSDADPRSHGSQVVN